MIKPRRRREAELKARVVDQAAQIEALMQPVKLEVKVVGFASDSVLVQVGDGPVIPFVKGDVITLEWEPEIVRRG